MVKLNRIYTRTGDDGSTGLGDGTRVGKDSLRVDAYGTVDEANSAIGCARLHADPAIDAVLARIQNEMFDLGADLCTPDRGVDLGYEPLRIIDAQVARLEQDIDAFNAGLAPLRSFILPAGTALSAHLHLARTICRRAERDMVALSRQPGEPVSPAAIRYVNRLSDLLFVLARIANDGGRADVLWTPGKTR